MSRLFLNFLILLIGFQSLSQSIKPSYIGTNILGLPSSTINLNYSADYSPYLTPMVEMGYTLGAYNYDLIAWFLSPHCKCSDGYDLERPTGGYIKLGTYLNLRKDVEIAHFYRLGLFVINSMVHEKGVYSPPPYELDYPVEHTVFISGLSTSLGYEFKLGKRLKSNIDFQLSLPANNYKDLYSYQTFIPGMGYLEGGGRWYPMLIMNLKYRL